MGTLRLYYRYEDVVATELKEDFIAAKHLRIAVRTDYELNKLFTKGVIGRGGDWTKELVRDAHKPSRDVDDDEDEEHPQSDEEADEERERQQQSGPALTFAVSTTQTSATGQGNSGLRPATASSVAVVETSKPLQPGDSSLISFVLHTSKSINDDDDEEDDDDDYNAVSEGENEKEEDGDDDDEKENEDGDEEEDDNDDDEWKRLLMIFLISI